MSFFVYVCLFFGKGGEDVLVLVIVLMLLKLNYMLAYVIWKQFITCLTRRNYTMHHDDYDH